MAEAVRYSKSEKAPSKDDRNNYQYGKSEATCNNLLSATQIDIDAEARKVSSASTSMSSHSSYPLSAAVDSNILTLLLLASETLRVGGKLVFFAPHREIDGARIRDDQYNRGDSIEQSDPAESELHSLKPSDQVDGKENVAEITSSGLGAKMSKRKAFKRRARITMDKVDNSSKQPRATRIERSTSISRSSPTSPLDFLPPLPDSLTLVGYHEQVMSPSFSRWLCVIQKT